MGLTYASIYGFNAGQACVAGSRILVQRGVFDEVLERIEGIAKSIVVGDPSDPTTSMGPLISQEQYEKDVYKRQTQVSERDHGARVGARPTKRNRLTRPLDSRFDTY